MATVGVKVGFDGRDVQTGFQRLTGSAQRFAGDLEKKLSFKGAASSLLSGFGLGSVFSIGEKLASTIAAAIQGGSEEGWKAAAEAADKYDSELRAKFMGDRSPNQNIAMLEQEKRAAQADASAPRRQLAAGEGNWWTANSGGLVRGLANQLGLVGAETESEATKRRAEAGLKVLALEKEITSQKERQERLTGLGDARTALYDARQVMRGQMTPEEQQRRNTERVSARYLDSLAAFGGSDPRTKQAFNAMLQAQNSDEALRVARERDAALGPAIVANSLAKISGGGNIGVFGSGDAALAEARKASGYLQQIAINTARTGGSFITVAPASDIGN